MGVDVVRTPEERLQGLPDFPFESSYREIDGVRLAYLDEGEGPPVVYLHGVVGETRWYPFHQALAERFDVIAPAHPGYGSTEGLGEIDAAEDVVFHYLDLFDGLGIVVADVSGHGLRPTDPKRA